jgi:hypothetical protein
LETSENTDFTDHCFGRESQQNQIRAHQCNPWFPSSSCLPALLIPPSTAGGRFLRSRA